jgi:replication factor C large subunit
VLRDICRKEGVEFDEAALEAIAAADAGDLRAAIHDLQGAVGGGDRITADDVRVDGRDRGVGIFPFLDAVFKTADAQTALERSFDVDETPEDLLRWIDDKVGAVYGYSEWARATEFLSNAARWIGRVYTTDRTYRWWRYASDNVVGGVAAVRDGDHGGYTRYGGPPWRNRRNKTRAFVVGQLATHAGMSMQHARQEVLPVLRALTELCSPRERTVQVAGTTRWMRRRCRSSPAAASRRTRSPRSSPTASGCARPRWRCRMRRCRSRPTSRLRSRRRRNQSPNQLTRTATPSRASASSSS